MCQVQLTTPQPSSTPTYQLANKLMADRTKLELAQWYHSTLLVPFKQTLIKSIKNCYLATWTNLTIYLVNKHIPQSTATPKSHMHQTRKSIKSTKQQDPKQIENPPMKPLVQHTNTVFNDIINHKRQIATDLTVKFPVTSNRGKYIYIYMYFFLL